MTIEIGDWVAFYRNGSITYAEVRYRRMLEHLGRQEENICTTQGYVCEDEILEIRKVPHD